jgi:hypothetical protein
VGRLVLVLALTVNMETHLIVNVKLAQLLAHTARGLLRHAPLALIQFFFLVAHALLHALMGSGGTPPTGNAKVVILLAINALAQRLHAQLVFLQIFSHPQLAPPLALRANLEIHPTEYVRLVLPPVQPVQGVLLPALDVMIRNSLVAQHVLIHVRMGFGVNLFLIFK